MTTWRDGSSGSRPHRDLEDRAHTIDTGAALPTLPDALYGAGTVFVRTTDYSEWITDGAAWHPLASDDLSFYPDGGVTGPYMCEERERFAHADVRDGVRRVLPGNPDGRGRGVHHVLRRVDGEHHR